MLITISQKCKSNFRAPKHKSNQQPRSSRHHPSCRTHLSKANFAQESIIRHEGNRAEGQLIRIQSMTLGTRMGIPGKRKRHNTRYLHERTPAYTHFAGEPLAMGNRYLRSSLGSQSEQRYSLALPSRHRKLAMSHHEPTQHFHTSRTKIDFIGYLQI